MENPNSEQVDLWVWRGYAIGSYSMVEHALCDLFTDLMGCTSYRGAVVFFKMHNARARNTIIEKLINDNFGIAYNPFWNSLFKILKQLDDMRNSIVHWTTIYRFSVGEQKTPVPDRLIPPNMHGGYNSETEIDLDDLKAFAQKANVVGELIATFHNVSFVKTSRDAALTASWLDIFRKGLTYPLPSDHLIFQNWRTSESPPRPSQA